MSSLKSFAYSNNFNNFKLDLNHIEVSVHVTTSYLTITETYKSNCAMQITIIVTLMNEKRQIRRFQLWKCKLHWVILFSFSQQNGSSASYICVRNKLLWTAMSPILSLLFTLSLMSLVLYCENCYCHSHDTFELGICSDCTKMVFAALHPSLT